MTKGIAIQTILMLLVGILVVGIIVYMVYRYFVGAPLGEAECRTRITAWCSQCKLSDFNQNGVQMTQDLAECVSTYFGPAAWDAPNCGGTPGYCDCNDRSLANTQSLCSAFTP